MRFAPEITTDFYHNGGCPYADGKINVSYYYIYTIYQDTPSGKMIIRSDSVMVKSIILTDGLIYDPVFSGDDFHTNDPVALSLKMANDYIREHSNHFLEEVYEKIPEARNADEIIY